MKFSGDTAIHMLKFLDVPDKISFAQTSKRHNKYFKKHMAPKFFVGQILYENTSLGNLFYQVLKVTKKTVTIQPLHWRGTEKETIPSRRDWIERSNGVVAEDNNGWELSGRKSRCKMKREYRAASYFTGYRTICHWGLSHNNHRIWGCRGMYDGEFEFHPDGSFTRQMIFGY